MTILKRLSVGYFGVNDPVKVVAHPQMYYFGIRVILS